MNKIVIIGATSSIAHQTALLFAREGVSFVLAGRNQNRLDACAKDLQARGAKNVSTLIMDAANPSDGKLLFEQSLMTLGEIDLLYIAHGSLTDQARANKDTGYALEEFMVNFNSAVGYAMTFAEYFEKRQMGNIAVLSSVAGDRGRGSNYIYGAAKGGLSIFLQGLRNRLAKSGVNVLTIKPGFVDTPMTADVPKNPLFAKPEVIAKGIYSAIKNGKDVIYLPWFWRWIMLIVRMVPERIFKKMSL
ncbi:MAG: SDR family oxidoreductase [Ignavibacteriae bacterium]|nr:SDR family oxidoreductase [Ignavibacteriota bacterium]